MTLLFQRPGELGVVLWVPEKMWGFLIGGKDLIIHSRGRAQSFMLILMGSSLLPRPNSDTGVSHRRMHTPRVGYQGTELEGFAAFKAGRGQPAVQLWGGLASSVTVVFCKCSPEEQPGPALLAGPSRSSGDTQVPWQGASTNSRYNCWEY